MSARFDNALDELTATSASLGIDSFPATIFMWVKWNTIGTNNSHLLQYNNTGTHFLRCASRQTATGQAVAVQSATTFSGEPGDQTSGTWYPLLFRFDSALTYIENSVGSASVTTAQTYQTNSGQNIAIGAGVGSAEDCWISHVTLYNSDLTAQQQDDLLAGSDPSTVGSPVNYWSLVGATPSLTDSVGSVTLTNTSVTFAADDPVLSGGVADIIGDINVGFLVEAAFNPAAQGSGGGASKKNKQAYLIY